MSQSTSYLTLSNIFRWINIINYFSTSAAFEGSDDERKFHNFSLIAARRDKRLITRFFNKPSLRTVTKWSGDVKGISPKIVAASKVIYQFSKINGAQHKSSVRYLNKHGFKNYSNLTLIPHTVFWGSSSPAYLATSSHLNDEKEVLFNLSRCLLMSHSERVKMFIYRWTLFSEAWYFNFSDCLAHHRPEKQVGIEQLRRENSI